MGRSSMIPLRIERSNATEFYDRQIYRRNDSELTQHVRYVSSTLTLSSLVPKIIASISTNMPDNHHLDRALAPEIDSLGHTLSE